MAAACGPPQGRLPPVAVGDPCPDPSLRSLWRRSGRSNGPFDRTMQLGFEPDCWRALCQTGVRSRGVVMVEPRRQCSTAFLGTGIGLGVGPLPQTGLDEPLRLAVGAGGVGSGALVSGAGRCHRRPERFASVGGAVIGHDPLDADALTARHASARRRKPISLSFFSFGRISLYARREASSMQTCKASQPML